MYKICGIKERSQRGDCRALQWILFGQELCSSAEFAVFKLNHGDTRDTEKEKYADSNPVKWGFVDEAIDPERCITKNSTPMTRIVQILTDFFILFFFICGDLCVSAFSVC